ncbi:MAG: hypothetical protein JO360_04405 [Acidobacteria bacterium]|nr:hypothetical protein [Acidobacteriota bacterium]
MKRAKANLFCKRASCPSAETLLTYRSCGLEAITDEHITQHLAACDFCGAELQLLGECPQADEGETFATEIPLPLRRLAEEILAGSPLTAEMFSEAGYEKERLTLTDA